MAVHLLGRGLGNDYEDYQLLGSLLVPQAPGELQCAVMQRFAECTDPRIATLLLKRWQGYSPALRERASDVLLSRQVWTHAFVQALEDRRVPPSECARRLQLLQHNDEGIRTSAGGLFRPSSKPDRGKLIDECILTFPEQTDVHRGAKLFMKKCYGCHKLGEIGSQVGPDLARMGDNSVPALLMAILDPNRSVDAHYVRYRVATKNGSERTGMITCETGDELTFSGLDGKAYTVVRGEIEHLSSAGKSLMPEGLERELPPQDLADVIAFLRCSFPEPRPKILPGNRPTIVRPTPKSGVIELTAATAAIFGPTLTFHRPTNDLRMWTHTKDRAEWTFEIPTARNYDIWIEYATPTYSAGNRALIEVAGKQMQHTTVATGRSDAYDTRFFDYRFYWVPFPAGKYTLTLRVQGEVQEPLINLRAIQLIPR